MVLENPSQTSKWSFLRRFQEGYDLFIDADYVRWLELHHPEALPPDRYTLTPANDNVITFLADIFDGITAETPLTVTDGEAVTPKQTPSSPDSTEWANDEVAAPKQTTSSAGSKDSTERVSGSSTERQTTVSKYLVSPTTETPSGAGRKSLPCARLLTSAESLVMLEEKEKKQQDEKEVKEK